jgi:hypothetical protein
MATTLNGCTQSKNTYSVDSVLNAYLQTLDSRQRTQFVEELYSRFYQQKTAFAAAEAQIKILTARTHDLRETNQTLKTKNTELSNQVERMELFVDYLKAQCAGLRAYNDHLIDENRTLSTEYYLFQNKIISKL